MTADLKRTTASIVELNREIDERKQAEDAFRESETQKKAILDASIDVIRLVDKDMKIIWANKTTTTELKAAPEQLVGSFCYEAVAGRDTPCPGCPTKKALKSGKIEHAFMSHKELKGIKEKTYWDDYAVPVKNESGGIINLIQISRNITDRKQAEDALRESEERYRTLVESSTDAILMMDNERRIVSFNRAFLDLFAYKKDELIGESIRIIHQSDDSFRSFEETAYPMIEKVGSFRTEWEFRRKDGMILPVETVTSTVRSPDGSITGYVAIIRDISERKQAEEEKERLQAQLRRTQKMEAISTLAGGIAHDFNNILSAIMGYTQLARMQLDSESEAYPDLKEVLQSANRAKLLIQQILAIGRSQEQERQPMQLKHIVREGLKFLRSTLPSTIEIRETYDEDVGVIDADPTQMHQVLMNLCTNAGQAMEQNGGILKVSLRNVTIGPLKQESGAHLEPGPYLRLGVSDTGYGIAPEIREKIFDPYFTTKEPGVGTGIGLSVVHGIVAQHGGDITVESEAGQGATFHVYLPLIQAEEAQPEVKEETPLPKGNERILFIDDEAALAKMGKKMLKGLGYDVTAMTSSLEALALFKEDPKQFDLVITDTTIPHMTGDMLAQEMMKIRPDIPIILCTGHSKRISREKAKEMGIKAFLMKPVAMRDLAETVRKVFGDDCPMSPPASPE